MENFGYHSRVIDGILMMIIFIDPKKELYTYNLTVVYISIQPLLDPCSICLKCIMFCEWDAHVLSSHTTFG